MTAGRGPDGSGSQKVKRDSVCEWTTRAHHNPVYDHHFSNNKDVEDITLPWAYKPHSGFLLICVLLGLWAYCEDTDDPDSLSTNVHAGLYAVIVVFLVVSAVALPNGAFVRPHPAFWRLMLGLSILYLLILVFLLFQTPSHIAMMLNFFGVDTNANDPLDSPTYATAETCKFTWENISSRLDLFVVAHFLGWLVKAVMLRSWKMCWFISGLWEMGEVIFATMLPNFAECWWDQFLLDFLLSNGLGIICGFKLCTYLELKLYEWDGIMSIPNRRGQIKRAALQFTPESWTVVEWLPLESPRRFLSLFFLTIAFLVAELNTFLLKHIFKIPSSDMMNFWRLVLWTLWGAVSLRQYYYYCTDPQCKRIGTQSWVTMGILALETLVVCKFGGRVFEFASTTRVAGIWLIAVTASTLAAWGIAFGYKRTKQA